MDMAGVSSHVEEIMAAKSNAENEAVVNDAIKQMDQEVILNPDPELLDVLEGRLLLKKMRIQETAGTVGLILPEKERTAKGTIYARVKKAAEFRLAQDGVTKIPMRVKKDMIVLINEYAGLPVGRTEDYIMLTEVEVLGIHTGATGAAPAAAKSFSNNPRAL